MNKQSFSANKKSLRLSTQELKEKCGLFGVAGPNFDGARLTYFGLFALQHRGQESTGIVSSNGKNIYSKVGVGLVAHVYDEQNLKTLKGGMAIGHNRYSTSGPSTSAHCQPVIIKIGSKETVSLAHNGNLPTTKKLEEFLNSKKIDHKHLNDSEMMTEAIAYYLNSGKSLKDAIKLSYPLFTGAFCLLIMTKNKLAVVRDRAGIRPLSIGKLNGGYVFASETCALDIVGAKFLRDVKPGELIIVEKGKLSSTQLEKGEQKLDIFEFVYFARPDSILMGQSVDLVRQKLGEELAKEKKIKADVVIPVPDSAVPAALGYSRASGIPFYMGLIKNRYVHRTFITPEQHTRKQAVALKLNPMKHILGGKKIVLVDDSIVRGTTMKGIIKLIRGAGAKEVHLVISSAPVMFPDFYGINTPKQSELIAAYKSVEEIRKVVGADSLQYLSFQGTVKATGVPESMLCTSCFTGNYPIDIGDNRWDIKYPKKRIAILVSNGGTGTNMQSIIDATKSGKINAKVTAVISDTEDSIPLQKARKQRIKTFVNKNKEDLLKILEQLKLDYVCLAGWKQVITNEVIDAFPNRILNTHPGLIPEKGNGTPKNPDGTVALWNKGKFTDKAIQNFLDEKSTYAGVTNHFLTHDFDNGPILGREFEKVQKRDSVESLYKRLKVKENALYVSVLSRLCNG